MFDWIGKKAGRGAVAGAVETIAADGHKLGILIGGGLKDVMQGIMRVPGLNIPPLLWKIMADAPQYFDKLPDEQKQAFFNAAVAAGTKAMMEYAKK